MAVRAGIAPEALGARRDDPAMLLTLAEEIRARDEAADDGRAEELLAQIHEQIQLARREAYALGGAKKHYWPKVHPVPRPGEIGQPSPSDEVVMTPREYALHMAA